MDVQPIGKVLNQQDRPQQLVALDSQEKQLAPLLEHLPMDQEVAVILHYEVVGEVWEELRVLLLAILFVAQRVDLVGSVREPLDQVAPPVLVDHPAVTHHEEDDLLIKFLRHESEDPDNEESEHHIAVELVDVVDFVHDDVDLADEVGPVNAEHLALDPLQVDQQHFIVSLLAEEMPGEELDQVPVVVVLVVFRFRNELDKVVELLVEVELVFQLLAHLLLGVVEVLGFALPLFLEVDCSLGEDSVVFLLAVGVKRGVGEIRLVAAADVIARGHVAFAAAFRLELGFFGVFCFFVVLHL